VLRGWPPAQQQKAIMQRAYIWNSVQEVAADLQEPGYLMEDPKGLLGVFETLVSHDEVGLAIFVWQGDHAQRLRRKISAALPAREPAYPGPASIAKSLARG
jgi:hypothetical protein